ncbi:MAG: hypothetical protein VKJ04_00490 [Vampirovibrionales bacterium]|nr:hypothetical protein [Vampirovibrionales bacterium]
MAADASNMLAENLLQILLWSGLTLSLISEWLRPKIQSGGSLKAAFHFEASALKHTAYYALIPLIAAILLQSYGWFEHFSWLGAGLLAPALLRSTGYNSALTGLLLLALCWLLPYLVPTGIISAEDLSGIHIALISGFLLSQFLQAFFAKTQDTQGISDVRAILPATFWLIAITWINLTTPDHTAPGEKSLLALQISTASVLILSAIFRLLPVLKSQKTQVSLLERYGKPIALSLASGFSVYALSENLLLEPSLWRWAPLVAGSVLLGGLFAACNAFNQEKPWPSTMLNIALLGLAMLAASRLFGTLGWIVGGLSLSLSHLHLPITNASANSQKTHTETISALWQVAALFFLGRSLLQIYLYQYNPNVTGINITHPYAGAALFAGVGLLLCAREFFSKLPLQALMAVLTILTLGTSYYLHAEATGSFLVSALMAGAAVALFSTMSLGHYPGAPFRQASTFHQASSMMLLPCWLVAYSLLLSPLLDLGDTADKPMKLMVLALVFGVGCVLLLLFPKAQGNSAQAEESGESYTI